MDLKVSIQRWSEPDPKSERAEIFNVELGQIEGLEFKSGNSFNKK